ncbi:MBL fold metallo-hydrolase [Conexibacter sp. JD483]|uniref:MBL fold metallo-hydrolase n=1 Tax=unclassified Conexibacter TaxID=2627773 RepID=UPI002715A456|nr:MULTISPECIES: MBL fold metallo-hydrolase [unclassified Conexibacter]MDO8189176.1 MBL fold metallo-hydrolase [Conexibacter sp. CPCC 205706]MDO8201938.1 MBL fold metallo-hydrolase [Conexibacter sp. CPCC 205762]MDR9372380.1 MBL fold metallo-hydrolase [Conexibacter sp. JD483]
MAAGVDLLARHDVAEVRADNPGPFTLTGTNSWIVGRDPAWVIDPGPALDAHLDALAAALAARGGLGGIALTHDHPDHAEGVPGLLARSGPAPVAAARGAVDVTLADGAAFGPLTAVATPGHSPDHLAYVLGPIGFSGDVVLGAGSTLLIPEPGALRGYLRAMERLRTLRLRLIAPGHGPLVEDPESKLRDSAAHRLERERMLLAALAAGDRTVDELLDSVWADAPAALRMAATVTLAAHLDKLDEEGRLPAGVERPPWPLPLGRVGQHTES